MNHQIKSHITAACESLRLPISLFSTELDSNHPLNSSTGGEKFTSFLSKPKSNAWRKNLLRWGLQPCEIPSCEIGAHLAWSQWFRWKIPLQSVTEITKTATLLFSSPLSPSHYSLPHSFIHLSELFQVAACYLSITVLTGFISIDILITSSISNSSKNTLPPLFSCLLCCLCPAPLHPFPLRHYLH